MRRRWDGAADICLVRSTFGIIAGCTQTVYRRPDPGPDSWRPLTLLLFKNQAEAYVPNYATGVMGVVGV